VSGCDVSQNTFKNRENVTVLMATGQVIGEGSTFTHYTESIPLIYDKMRMWVFSIFAARCYA